jgi:hypothetical protein
MWTRGTIFFTGSRCIPLALLSISHLELEGRFVSDEPLFKIPFMLGITICVSFDISTVKVQ